MFQLYVKLLIRQFRQSSIRLFCLAIAVACAVTFSISLLGNRLEQLFNMQAKEVLAADLVIQSSTELSKEQFKIIDSISLEDAKTIVFQSMANADSSNQFLLSSVKAVSEDYPLLGELQISNELYGETQAIQDIPKQGEAWVEDRVLNELNIDLNQYINVGEKAFKVTRVLVYEPDRGNNFYSFTPRILINWQDLEATQVVRPGSRVTYRYLFVGDEVEIDSLKQNLSGTLQLNQKFVTVQSANQSLSDTLDRAYRFLNVTALISVILGAIAAALVSYKYANDMTYQYALLRCLGLKSQQMVAAILIPFLFFTLLAIAIGLLIGGLVHIVILITLADLIPETLPAASAEPYLISSLTALIIVISFAWPFLNKLLHTAPKLLLNRIESKQTSILSTVIYILIGLAVLIYLSTNDIVISVYIIGIMFVFILITHYITKLTIHWLVDYTQDKVTSIKLAARSLNANLLMVAIQVIAVAMTFFSLALVTTIRDDLVTSWQAKVPKNAPNVFAINLLEKETQRFQAFLDQYKINHSPLYPIIRGRLSAVNQILINEYTSAESGLNDESLERDLALTWSRDLPENNKILNGEWHKVDEQINRVSVEEGIAENLEIEIGDTLTFTVEAEKISAVVTSIRSVEWESFMPNFYMIFSPGTLDELPTTYIASLYIDKEERTLIRDFVEAFPSATFFDVDFLLNRIRQIANKVSYAVETVLYFSLLASLLIFISIEMILHKYRTYSTAIFKAVGADINLVQKVFRTEFILIGIMSGVIAYLLNTIVSIGVSNYVIEGNYVFNMKTAILCLVIAPLMVVITGYITVHRTKQTSVSALIAET